MQRIYTTLLVGILSFLLVACTAQSAPPGSSPEEFPDTLSSFLTNSVSAKVNLRAELPGDCSEVLADGVFNQNQYTSSDQLSISEVYELLQLDKGQAEQKLGVSGTFPINGIPVGAGWTESDWENWQQETREKLDISYIENHYEAVTVYQADSNILQSWENCMLGGDTGVFGYLREQDERHISFYLHPKSVLAEQ